MPQHCIYCGRELKRKIKGRPATTEQLLHAAAYHHPHPVTATYICDTHRLHPPTSLSSLKPKRDRTSSLDTSSSSSDSHPSSKRQRVVEILSSLSQPQQQPLTIPTSLPATDQVTATTPTSSTQSVATTTTYMSVSQEDDTSVASDATHTPLTSPLVHPYEQALAKSKQLIVTTSSETSSCSTTITVPTQQWKQFHDQLHAHVLSPNSRDKHMIHIVTSDPSNITITGRYLSVYDVKIEDDIFPNQHANIIQEMISSSSGSHTRASSFNNTRSIQRLKNALPFTTPTHTQESYSHHRITAPPPPPVLQTALLSQSEAYQRLVHASTISTMPTPHQHIFTPSININCVTDLTIRQRLISIAKAVQHQFKQSVPHKHQELECDHVFSSPLDGFGIDGLQVYIKSGECITWLHDELLWCSALNYMLKESKGCALWIAVGLHDLKQVMSLTEMEKLLLIDKAKKNVMEVGTLLDKLIQYGVHIEYVFQKPGQLISSPPGIGAAHFVYSQGILMTQLAWNYSFTIPGAIQCLSFWGIDDNHDHLADGNTSMATRTVLPLYTMQIHGYDMGLMDQIHRYRMFIQQLQSQSNRRYNIKPNSRLSSAPCPTCLYRQDWLRINNQCIHCYFRKHHQELK